MPTRRQLLSGSAVGVVGAGAAAVLASCTPPPPAVAPQALRDALPRSSTATAATWSSVTRTGTRSKNIVQNVFGRAAWFPDGNSICHLPRRRRRQHRHLGPVGAAASDGSLLHPITNPAARRRRPRSVRRAGRADHRLQPRHASASAPARHLDRAGQRAGAAPGARAALAASRRASATTRSSSSTRRRTASAASPPPAGRPTLIARGRRSAGSSPSRPGRRPTTGSLSSAAIPQSSASLCYVAGDRRQPSRCCSPRPPSIECPTWGSDSHTLHYARYERLRLRGPRRHRRVPAGDRRTRRCGSSVRSGLRRPTSRPCPDLPAPLSRRGESRPVYLAGDAVVLVPRLQHDEVMTEGLDLLRELEPAAEAALERHLRLAKEWMPHEYVPWGRGRDFTDEPWDAEPVDALADRADRLRGQPADRGQPAELPPRDRRRLRPRRRLGHLGAPLDRRGGPALALHARLPAGHPRGRPGRARARPDAPGRAVLRQPRRRTGSPRRSSRSSRT